MNRQKLATIGCIILSIVFSVSFGLFIHFKAFMPTVSNVYEKSLYYSEDGRTNLIIEVGDYDEGFRYSNYVTATVKNFGTNEQEVTFERSRKSAEEAYENAERYRTLMGIFTLVFIFILIIFTAYLIKNSIKRRYSKVLYPISLIVACTVMTIAMMHFLVA